MAKVAQIPRGQNRHADSLAMLASSMIEDVPRLIKVELIEEHSINTMASSNATLTTPHSQLKVYLVIATLDLLSH